MPAPNLLHHYATLHAAYLHARGERGTEYLLRQLPLAGAERVLELGFGTGTTLVKLKARYPELTLFGLEAKPNMIKKAAARLRFCGLKDRVALLHLDDRDRIPAQSIDLVYAESVLAILDENSLSDALGFVFNILKPTGLLALNESIWLSAVPLPERRAINAYCLEKFGIIQCNEAMAGMAATIALFEKQGYTAIFQQRMGNADEVGRTRKNYREYLSRLFTLLGKSRLLLQPKLRKTHARFSAGMGQLFEPGKSYLTGAILLFQK